jgi:low affinity Fe/Cu permease
MTMPSEAAGRPSTFDRFADAVNRFVSKAWFFALCVLLVLVWAPSYFVIKDMDTWQLIINTATTIVTFLLVALLQNTAKRGDDATQQKLNAIACALAVVLEDQDSGAEADELREAVGLEEKESS